ncbi:DNAJ heat shock N-terminal domain-containing protein [Cavenderia fasciculata]|uniref:DNAJ heat shock N-terminal domain-containing protein n=1 Tax=Cavenderia fasciculata TaxID=261658 RepID=F4PWK1_CACFS|nr:DNAJ heat shock N-terminal domain-containing protein [Cavenderia fasciculata]EGG20365.1 DNAJ heat shock N-terminal domain-containing protein [Cavenderia fasciculata]|eukprot:XP_004367348.1 DNAJ heat shock N-terminal domain-containing protein [Cavenderia fasciculata]
MFTNQITNNNNSRKKEIDYDDDDDDNQYNNESYDDIGRFDNNQDNDTDDTDEEEQEEEDSQDKEYEKDLNYTKSGRNVDVNDDIGEILESIDQGALEKLGIRKADGTPYQSMTELVEDLSKDGHTRHLLNITDTVEKKLESLPTSVIDTYLEQSSQLVQLHNVIQENDKILASIEEVFQSFDDELHDLIKDMPDTHVTTMLVSQSLENRMKTRDAVSAIVKRIVIPPSLINSITSDDINEEYVQNIQLLTKRVENLEDLMGIQAKFGEDIAFEIDLLKKKACYSVRDFLLKLIIGLRKPRTNVQILQQSKLFKYSALNQFIYDNSPSFAVEIKNLYLETVSRIFISYFKNYGGSLSKVYVPIATKSDVVGYYDNTIKGYFGTTSKAAVDTFKASAFNLNVPNLPNDIWTSIRSEEILDKPDTTTTNMLRRSHILLRATDAPLIVPHTAIKNAKKYPFEQIFRSMNILLLDTVCSEYLFDQKWFAKPLVSNKETSGLIKPMFDKIFQVFYENINQYVSTSYDCLGILLCIKLNQMFVNILNERRIDIPCLSNYFHQVDVILWDKFSELFKRNIDSLKIALTKDSGVVDFRPHIYTRRFSEFYASISEIIGGGVADSRVTAWVAVLRSSMERLLEHLSNNFPDKKTKSMFLINNYDVVLSVLRENNLPENDEGYILFNQLLIDQTNIYIEEQLYSHFKTLIDYIKITESQTMSSQQASIDKDAMNTLICDFSQRWRDVLQRSHLDVMTNYSNFNLGSNISKKIIFQFLIYYKRFDELVKRALKQSGQDQATQSIKTTFIPISTITYEVQKKNFITILLVFLLTIVYTSFATDIDTIIKEADELFKTARYDASVEKYTMAIDMIGDASSESSDMSSKLTSVLFKRAGIYQTKGKNILALSDLNRALQYNPTNIHAKLKRAKILTSLGRFEDATDEYKSVLKTKPDNPEAKKQLALIQKTSSQLERAKELYEGNKLNDLLPVLNSILESTPDNKQSRLWRCECTFNIKDYRRVIDDTTAVLKADGSNLEAMYWRSKAFFALGEKDAALKFIKDGLKFDSDHSKLKQELTRITKFDRNTKEANDFFVQGRYEESLRETNSALELEPNHPQYSPSLYLLKCKVLLKLRKGQDAINACGKSIELDDNSADAYYNRGEAFMYTEEYDRALADFQKAHEKSPNDHNIMDGIRRAQQKQKQAKRKDYYKLLGVDKGATPQEIKKAFKKLALTHHPDKGDQSEESKKKYVEMTEAYETLIDQDKRDRYDRGEDVNDPMAGRQQQQGFGGGFPFGGGFGFGGGGHHHQQQQHFTFNFGGFGH